MTSDRQRRTVHFAYTSQSVCSLVNTLQHDLFGPSAYSLTKSIAFSAIVNLTASQFQSKLHYIKLGQSRPQGRPPLMLFISINERVST